MVLLAACLTWRIHRQKSDIKELLTLISHDRDRMVPAVRSLVELLADIANAAAQSGDSGYLLAKRLDHILASPRGEGRTIKEQFLILADLYEAGLITYLEQTEPALTRNETALCGMIMLGLEPPCICRVFGYEHVQTLYNKRGDIRKKLHIETEALLEEYLSGLIDQLKLRGELQFRHLKQQY